MSLISKNIEAFYNASSEEDRLSIGLGPLEFERNKELIARYLPGDESKIVDVGGGTGKYSEWLANLGHRVVMVDPVLKHVKIAQKRASKMRHRFMVQQGEARDLEIPDEFADLVILHGPLYHLQTQHERLQAIREARRITKPGGIILGFAIGYTASTMVALMQGILHEEGVLDMCLSELSSGRHYAPETIPGILPEAYYHRPEELRLEFETAGLRVLALHAVEGVIWLEKHYFSTRSSEQKFNRLRSILSLTESDPNLLAVSPHIMAAAKKTIENEG